jgi:NAD-dependent SIR2 family protein deacetylase
MQPFNGGNTRLSGFYATMKDCRIIEINREPTPLTSRVSDFIIQGSTGEVLRRIAERIKRLKKIK